MSDRDSVLQQSGRSSLENFTQLLKKPSKPQKEIKMNRGELVLMLKKFKEDVVKEATKSTPREEEPTYHDDLSMRTSKTSLHNVSELSRLGDDYIKV